MPTEEITQKAIFSLLGLSSTLRPVSTGWGSAHHAALLLPLLFISFKLFNTRVRGWKVGRWLYKVILGLMYMEFFMNFNASTPKTT